MAIENVIEKAFERIKHDFVDSLREFGAKEPQQTSGVFFPPPTEWLTIEQLAIHWQLINSEGKPVTAGIYKWMRRPANENPLPFAKMGDLNRFNRAECDAWSREEAKRQNQKKRAARQKPRLNKRALNLGNQYNCHHRDDCNFQRRKRSECL